MQRHNKYHVRCLGPLKSKEHLSTMSIKMCDKYEIRYRLLKDGLYFGLDGQCSVFFIFFFFQMSSGVVHK